MRSAGQTARGWRAGGPGEICGRGLSVKLGRGDGHAIATVFGLTGRDLRSCEQLLLAAGGFAMHFPAPLACLQNAG